MKKVLSIVSAALVAITAAAQSPDTTSTVVGRKLNFEAPLFGLTMKNVKPKWSMIYFAGVRGGYSLRFNVPDEMNASGYFGELDLIEIRYRPWRDGNVFSCGLTYSIERHMLKKGYAFDNDGSFIPIPAGWLNNQSSSVEEIFSLNLGYTREWGDWKAGFFLSPGFGQSDCINTYRPGKAMPASGLWYGEAPGEGDKVIYYSDKPDRMHATLTGNYGLRLGIKAGIWYGNIGLTAGYNFTKDVGPSSSWKRYDSFNIGVTVRY